MVRPIGVELRCGRVDRQRDVLAERESGLPIASTIRSSAARLCSRSGAKPPSSPMPVDGVRTGREEAS